MCVCVLLSEGTSIFKEMVQNADDAGATEVAFCLDLRQHPTEGLAYEKMAKFQGLIPARLLPSCLLILERLINDAGFGCCRSISGRLQQRDLH
jgi:hypothetical protein